MAALHNTGTEPATGIHERVRQWAERQPDQIAISAEGTSLTYRQLVTRAELLAEQLSRSGVGHETAVGVTALRSPEFAVGALGILMAGAYYVPVDPGHPQARQEATIAEAGVRRMVTRPADVGRWNAPGPAGVAIPGDTGASPAPAGPRRATHPENLAYAIYTSGSTGRPKGVAVSHRNVLDLIDGDPRLRIAPGDVVAQFAPTSFDASVFELWCALGSGARVEVIARDDLTIHAMAGGIRAAAPDWLFLTTGLFHALMEQAPDALEGVTRVITGGDVLSARHVRAATGRCARVYAAYGPTETTVFSSLHRVDPAGTGERVPLGTPLAGRSMEVLDADLRPLPDGETGEIYVGGGGVARGYLHRPRESAERFVPDPFAAAPGRRIYRTGDLGRRLPDGAVEFVGRIDRQVKIRGFRVEPAEVEAFLTTCEGVSAAAVTVVGAAEEERRLVAYVAAEPGATLSQADLRYLADEGLPGYARPSYYALLDELPLDRNGKVDRRALPAPWRSRELMGLDDYVPAWTATEKAVATTLQELLGLDLVGRDDGFFALGGTSLQSVQVLERLRLMGYRLSSREFFAHPTVALLAELLDGRSGSTSGGAAESAGAAGVVEAVEAETGRS
ncbi:non-ribosomal peptide synthetase [Streptomyces sp. NBC_00669]|uniref:non-ribosomal peptide synthetase n=1 Tax=Streptomyces sp. NBC_00669 TaxID=2976011 RepID=UPI002E34A5BD|nr:non-ribosomal peptide synthetase [Streptomyces sp. NBC_00669]